MSTPSAAVWVDPGRMSGQPCIYGHRLTTSAIAALVEDGGIECVQGLYPYLTESQILGAVWYETEYGNGPQMTAQTWPMCGPPHDHVPEPVCTCGRPGLALALHLTPCALRDGEQT